VRSRDDVAQLKSQDKLSSPLKSPDRSSFLLSRYIQLLNHQPHFTTHPQSHTNSLTMAGRQFATFGGLAAVGAGTYYLYNAGGDPKLAQKKAERMYIPMNH
jgi:hypothetical protein